MPEDLFNNSRVTYRFDDVVLDGDLRRAEKDGQPRKITPRAFDVLRYLIEHRDRVVEKQELFEKIWEDKFVTDNALTRIVKEVRQVIGDDADNPRYIETIPKRGYRFIAEVDCVVPSGLSESAVVDASSIPRRPEQIETTDKRAQLRKFRFAAGAVVVVVILAVVLVWWLTRGKPVQSGILLPQRTTQVTSWAGLDLYPSLSPDGNSVAYSSDHSGNFEIYLRSLAAGSREIQVTSDGEQNFEPAWSPDGQWIAYYSKNRGGIWLVPSSGGKIRQVTEFGSRPAWSPDGKLIAFQSDPITDLGANAAPSLPPSTIWIVDAQGGNPSYVTQAGNPAGGHGEPSWSPDGKRIAFCVSNYETQSVWTVSIEGSDPKKITPRGYDPVYAPDGKKIFYGFDSALFEIPVSSAGEVAGDAKELIGASATRPRHFTMSAGGSKLAYTSLLISSNIWSIPVSGSGESAGAPVALTQDRSFRSLFPAFSPDGKKIAFHSWRAGGFSNIWLMEADGKNPTQLTTEGGAYPFWLPDGERVAFLSRRQGKAAMWVANLSSDQEKLVLDFPEPFEYVRLSPDGKQLAANINRGGVINIAVMPVDGGQPTQLTFDKEMNGFPCWSPDGQTLAIQIKRGDDTNIGTILSAGGQVVQLTSDKGQSWIYSFSPDGDKIAFAGLRDGHWDVWWVSRSTRQEKRLTDYTKLNAYVRYPAWSPRGNQIAYEYAETTGNIWVMDLK